MLSHIIVGEYSKGEELANAITHGIACALSIAGLVFLVIYATLNGNAWHIASVSIYGATLVLLFGVSTLYHAIPNHTAKRVLKICDHIAIYLLIAGSYTPFVLNTLRGPWGWTLFGIVWGITLAGIFFKIYFVHRFKFLSTMLYLAMGWVVVVAIKPLVENLPTNGLALLVLGGLAYSAGIIFYLLDEKIKFFHSIWHLFVLAGSVGHYFAIFFYVIP